MSKLLFIFLKYSFQHTYPLFGHLVIFVSAKSAIIGQLVSIVSIDADIIHIVAFCAKFHFYNWRYNIICDLFNLFLFGSILREPAVKAPKGRGAMTPLFGVQLESPRVTHRNAVALLRSREGGASHREAQSLMIPPYGVATLSGRSAYGALPLNPSFRHPLNPSFKILGTPHNKKT